MLHRSTGRSTSLEVITRGDRGGPRGHRRSCRWWSSTTCRRCTCPDGSPDEDERITAVVEGLKDLALDHDVPVLAVVAADKEGIASGKRMRVSDLRGSSALAYEADTVLMLNNKYDVVARHHLVYDLGNVERFQTGRCSRIEKNRSGADRVDLEFRKRFDQCRFEHGRPAWSPSSSSTSASSSSRPAPDTRTTGRPARD